MENLPIGPSPGISIQLLTLLLTLLLNLPIERNLRVCRLEVLPVGSGHPRLLPAGPAPVHPGRYHRTLPWIRRGESKQEPAHPHTPPFLFWIMDSTDCIDIRAFHRSPESRTARSPHCGPCGRPWPGDSPSTAVCAALCARLSLLPMPLRPSPPFTDRPPPTMAGPSLFAPATHSRNDDRS